MWCSAILIPKGSLKSRRISSCARRAAGGRGSGVAGDEDQFAIGGAGGVPLQEVLAVDRPAIFINAEQGHVQVVARIGEGRARNRAAEPACAPRSRSPISSRLKAPAIVPSRPAI